MATHDYVLADAAGAAFRADANNVLAAIVSNNSNATEPSPTFAYMWWADTTAGLLKLRNAANSAWITIGTLASANLGHAALSGANFTGPINEARGSVAMHATTMDLWAQPNIIDGTGSAVTITAIVNAPQAGARRVLYPIAATVITNGATFAVDGAANYTTAAGDAIEFEAITTSTYKVHITKKDGTAVGSTTGQVLQVVYATDAGTTTTSATLANVTVGTPTITPKSSSSTLIVEVMFLSTVAAGGAGTNTEGFFKLYDFGNSADVGEEYYLGSVSGAGTNVQSEAPCNVAAIVTNAALTARSFVLRARRGTTSTTVSVQRHVWKITEVKN